MAYRDRLPMPTAVTASEYLQPVGSPSTETQHLQPRVSTSCEVMSPHGTLHCTITEPRASQDSEGVNGYLVLVNAPPFADSTTPPLAGLAEALSVGTVRVDLTGCGRSSGEPIANSVNRDADDIRAVIEFLRHGRSVEQLKARARGARPNAEPSDAVLGILGIGGGGTAAVRYAALFPDESLHVCTVSARVTHSFALRSTFTWKQLDELKKAGETEIALPAKPTQGEHDAWAAPRRVLRVSQSDCARRVMNRSTAPVSVPVAGMQPPNAIPAFESLARQLHGSRDKTVPPAEAEALDALLREGGCAAHELRIVPGMGGDSELRGHESTLAYAIGDWLWRKAHRDVDTRYASESDAGPSGFNIFVDDLGQRVREIHASTRVNLPSIDNDDDDDDDDDDK